MKCPYCQEELEQGFIQSGHNILWTKKKHIISTHSQGKDDFIVAKNPFGGVTVSAFCCKECKKIIIEY